MFVPESNRERNSPYTSIQVNGRGPGEERKMWSSGSETATTTKLKLSISILFDRNSEDKPLLRFENTLHGVYELTFW